MGSLGANLAGKVRSVLRLLKPDSVEFQGMTLPIPQLRLGGPEFNDDSFFLESARNEAGRLIKDFGLSPKTHFLDLGCGVGRLPIGILSQLGDIDHYRGLDVDKGYVRWCRRHITRYHPTFQFAHIDVENPRYNPHGKRITEPIRLPYDDQEFDLIYLYSVFSHLTQNEVRMNLKEFGRILRPGGKVFLTAFLEEDVEDESVNPPNYRMDWRGPLHCVRFNKQFFESMLQDAGFAVDRFDYEKETNGQSGLYLSRLTTSRSASST